MDTVINMSTKHPALLHPEGLSEKNATAQDPPGDTPRPGRGPPESMLRYNQWLEIITKSLK